VITIAFPKNWHRRPTTVCSAWDDFDLHEVPIDEACYQSVFGGISEQEVLLFDDERIVEFNFYKNAIGKRLSCRYSAIPCEGSGGGRRRISAVVPDG